MNQSTRRKARHLLHFLLTWVMICTQITLPFGALLAAVQPTPQMARAVATEFGWSDWLADRSADFLALGQRFWGEPATAQATVTYGAPTPLLSTTHSATITTGRTGLCTALNCFIANAANVVDSSTTNFGNISIPLGLVGGVYFSVDTNTIFPTGYRAGFLVDNGGGLIDLSLFSSFSIKTYLNGTLQETAASGALLDVALFGGANSNAISFVTTKAFDEVRLEAGSLIGALLDLDVYYAFVQEPTYSVAAAPGGVTGGLRAWVKADVGAGASDGATVATWSDQSGNGYNFTQATTGAQPTYYATTAGKLLNFNPVLDFDGTGDYLRNTTVLMPSSSPYTFLAVGVDEDTGTGYRKIFGSEAIVDYFGLYKQGGATGDNGWVPYAIGGQARSSPFIGDRGSMGKGTKYSAEGGANGYWNGTNFTSDSRTDYAQPQIVGFNSLNSATSDPFYTWTDGYKEDPNWSPIVDGLVYRNQFFTQTSIGADITVELWKGRIPEFMAYSQSLSDSDIAKINTYLAIKYGITLGQGNGHVGKNGNNYNYVATDGTTIWDASTNSTYAYNIAGIGRDDAEALTQKQSQSIQAGFQPVIGLGAIAATNAANSSTFSADKSYLIWGDNGQAASFAAVYNPTSFTPAAGYFRMNRVWKVQETGAITNVMVQATGADHLLVSSDPTFASGVTEIAFNSGSATIDFANGQFFTFGAEATAPGGVASNLTAWWKADMGAVTSGSAATDNSMVDTWRDQGLNDHDLTQSNSTLRPEWLANNGKFNFNPSVTFVPNGYMEAEFATAQWDNPDGTIYVIYNQETVKTGWRALVDFGLTAVDTNNPQVGMSDNNRIASWMDGFDRDNTNWTPQVNETRLIGYDWQFNVGGHSYYYDGEPFTGSATHKIGSSAIDIGSFIHIGGDPSAEYFPGQIAEVAIYSERHDAAARARTQSYFALKYGVTLDANPTNATTNFDYVDSTGATIWAGNSANSGYHNDIAGIGRDDASALHQKQAKSVNSDDVVTISLGTPAATNAANANTFAANRSFLLWGNNNGATTYATSYTPSSFTPAAGYFRIDRVWKVQESGTITNVVVQATGAEHLLVSNDPTFATGVTEIAFNSGRATVDFTNGQFFTFGKAITAPGAVVNNLVFWSKADVAGCAPGDACVDWDDLSANENPIETIGAMTLQAADEDHNFYPFFSDFSTTNYFKDMNSSFATPWPPIDVTEISVFAVARANSLTADGRITGMDNDDNLAAEPGLSIFDGSPAFYRFSSGPGRVTLSDDVAVNALAIFGARTAGTQLTLGLDGKYTASALTAGGGFAGDIFNIGYGTWDISGPFPGDIQEVIWYRTDVSNTERQRIESYLALKYGITLDQSTAQNYLASDGTTLVWNATANGAYSNNIAGIGRDDATGLHQKQSTSTNVGFHLVMGLGTIAASNAANTNTFSANKSFLIWGDNNGAFTLSAAYNGGSNNRLARVWKVQETGTVGAVKLILPRSALPTSGLRTLIVHSSDATFGTTDRTVPLTVQGGNYVATVDFNNGDYFTFSSSSTLPEINVTPTTIDFGTVNTGSTSPAQAVTIQNQGDVSLSISSIALSGADAARFAISSNNCGSSVSAGGSCTVQLTFTPTAAGSRSALLVITSNDSDESTVNVALTGTTPGSGGGAGTLDQYNLAVTKSASVSNATVGTPFTYTITVLNKGTVAASNVVMTDQLPAGVTFGSANATSGGNCTHNSGTVTCTWASLSGGASATVTISVTP